MSSYHTVITEYFHESLQTERQTISNYDGKKHIHISFTEFKQGTIPHHKLNRLKTTSEEIELTIAPVYFSREQNQLHKHAPQKIIPILVPCKYSKRTEQLSPMPNNRPWFVRDYFEPICSEEKYTLADYEQAQEALNTFNKKYQEQPWSEYFRLVQQAIRKVIT